MPSFDWDTDYVITGTIDGANYTTKCTDILPNGVDTVIGSTTNSAKFTLFAYGGAPTTVKYRFRGIFYYMILRDENNVELYHFVPAVRNADNVEGILDTVSNTFYTYA